MDFRAPPDANPRLRLRLEPLVSTCNRLGVEHLSLLGSARRRPLREVSDIDLHLVVSQVDRSVFELIVAAAEATAQRLAVSLCRTWRLELRHGPFKPAPSRSADLQLHLLLDDTASAGRITSAMLFQRAASGVLIAGRPLDGNRFDSIDQAVWLREAQIELLRWRQAVANGEIPFRHWLFDPEPRLAEARTAAKSAWDLMCLARGAATASDLHYRPLALASAAPPMYTLTCPLLEQLREPATLESLPHNWHQISSQILAVIDRRLEHLDILHRS
jgi:hypothetical protein